MKALPQAIRALAQGGTERLIGVQRSESKMCRCTLNLGCNGIGDVGAESLAGVLGQYSSLVTLACRTGPRRCSQF